MKADLVSKFIKPLTLLSAAILCGNASGADECSANYQVLALPAVADQPEPMSIIGPRQAIPVLEKSAARLTVALHACQETTRAKIRPELAETYLFLGVANLQVRRPGDARNAFARAVETKAFFDESRASVDRLLMQKSWRAAFGELRAITVPAVGDVSLVGDVAMPFSTAVVEAGALQPLLRGIDLAAAGRYKEALHAFQQAVRLAPTVQDTNYFAGIAALASGDHVAGRAYLISAVRGYDPSPSKTPYVTIYSMSAMHLLTTLL